MTNEKSNWVYAGGLNYELSEGDVICVFSQYGEITGINLVRDPESGLSKGYCFICYEDKRSTELAVDNFNETMVVGRKIKVSYVENYRAPKNYKRLGQESIRLIEEGCAPKPGDKKPEVMKQDKAKLETANKDLSQSSSDSIQFLERRDNKTRVAMTNTSKETFENSMQPDHHRFGQKPSYHQAINSGTKHDYPKRKSESVTKSQTGNDSKPIDDLKRVKKEEPEKSSANSWSRPKRSVSQEQQGWKRPNKNVRHDPTQIDSGALDYPLIKSELRIEPSESNYPLDNKGEIFHTFNTQGQPLFQNRYHPSPGENYNGHIEQYREAHSPRSSEKREYSGDQRHSPPSKIRGSRSPSRSRWTLRRPKSREHSRRSPSMPRSRRSPSISRYRRSPSISRYRRSPSMPRYRRSPSMPHSRVSPTRSYISRSPSRFKYVRPGSNYARNRPDKETRRERSSRLSPTQRSRLSRSRSQPRQRRD